MVTTEEVVDAVESARGELIELLRAAVQIPSITGQEEQIGRFIYRSMKDLGIDSQVVEAAPGRPNILGVWSGEPGPRLVFNGHMDVVHPGPSEDWEIDPWSGALVEDCVYGRGTVDMKSGLCASIIAVAVLKRMGFVPRGSILLTAVCDEQRGGRLGTIFLLKQGFIRGDYGINCEPTNLRVEIAHKGIFRCNITIRGRAIHASRPWLGEDAIERAHRIIGELYALRDSIRERTHPVLGSPTLVIGTIQGGAAPNMIASKCEFTVDRRLVPGDSHDVAEADLRAILEKVAADFPGLKVSYDVTNRRPLLDVPSNAAIVTALRESHRTLAGREPQIGAKDAGTDASLISEHTGMPMPVYGPGDYLKYSVAPNEHVSVADVVFATKVYALTTIGLLQ